MCLEAPCGCGVPPHLRLRQVWLGRNDVFHAIFHNQIQNDDERLAGGHAWCDDRLRLRPPRARCVRVRVRVRASVRVWLCVRACIHSWTETPECDAAQPRRYAAE
jgi:hypothetical protein